MGLRGLRGLRGGKFEALGFGTAVPLPPARVICLANCTMEPYSIRLGPGPCWVGGCLWDLLNTVTPPPCDKFSGVSIEGNGNIRALGIGFLDLIRCTTAPLSTKKGAHWLTLHLRAPGPEISEMPESGGWQKPHSVESSEVESICFHLLLFIIHRLP